MDIPIKTRGTPNSALLNIHPCMYVRACLRACVRMCVCIHTVTFYVATFLYLNNYKFVSNNCLYFPKHVSTLPKQHHNNVEIFLSFVCTISPRADNMRPADVTQRNTIQYNTIQYNTTQYNTIQYNTIQCNAMQCNAMQYNTMQYIIQYNTTQCNTYYNTCTKIFAKPSLSSPTKQKD